jgi:hypothetical protein
MKRIMLMAILPHRGVKDILTRLGAQNIIM